MLPNLLAKTLENLWVLAKQVHAEGEGGGGGLFSGGEEEEESGDEAMDVSMTAPAAPDAMNGGAKRKLVEEDDYD